MELEEMKKAWVEIDKKIEKQELLTQQLIEKMTQQNYNSKLNKIGRSEYMGGIICFMASIYLIVNFTKIADAPLQIFALIAIALLIILPIISLKSWRTIKSTNISTQSYVEAISDFGNRKIRFQKLQKLNVSLGLFLVIIAVPVLSAIQGKDIGQVPYFWTLIFPISIMFFLGFSWWVLKSYDKVLNDTEKMVANVKS